MNKPFSELDQKDIWLPDFKRTIGKNKVVLGVSGGGRASYLKRESQVDDNLQGLVDQQGNNMVYPFDETDFKGFEISKVRDEVDDSL
ncbi:hypothetical protein [Bacillus inaquosorum]|uniref:hypothetical protein n=1 Tax=Bacillus inaquosorum TaxID=483913 RepID=UPI00227E1982|nr:hypothetical protein [Bacillus inaquosorum]MCY9397617.1 hypothetical protein [Bacillus inaquosorum]